MYLLTCATYYFTLCVHSLWPFTHCITQSSNIWISHDLEVMRGGGGRREGLGYFSQVIQVHQLFPVFLGHHQYLLHQEAPYLPVNAKCMLYMYCIKGFMLNMLLCIKKLKIYSQNIFMLWNRNLSCYNWKKPTMSPSGPVIPSTPSTPSMPSVPFLPGVP